MKSTYEIPMSISNSLTPAVPAAHDLFVYTAASRPAAGISAGDCQTVRNAGRISLVRSIVRTGSRLVSALRRMGLELRGFDMTASRRTLRQPLMGMSGFGKPALCACAA